MIRFRTAAVYVALAAALCGATACSSATTDNDADTAPPTSSEPAPTTSPSTAPTSTTSPTTSDSAAPSATTGTAATSPIASACSPSQLRTDAAEVDFAGLDRHVVRLTFTNISDVACTLTGYPGAAIVDESGAQAVQAKRVVGGPVGGTIEKIDEGATLTVNPGVTAHAFLDGVSTKEEGAAQAGCVNSTYPSILVTPPNTQATMSFALGWPRCYTFDIHPVRIDT